MSPQGPAFFNQAVADNYDQQAARLAPLRDALHLLASAILSELPTEARILCVGAGTGLELIYLAQKFPQWQFTAVEPSAPMLEVCRRRTAELGIASRCIFHEGYLESLPATEPFDAATSLLVSQFILDPAERTQFFRTIAERLRPGGYLVSADLASDVSSAAYRSLLEVWLRLMKTGYVTDEKINQMRAAYGRDVALLPIEQVNGIIAAGGFETPVLFFQTGLIHAWYAASKGDSLTSAK
jgi:tRNA (cmo5U34)-methyltransferase